MNRNLVIKVTVRRILLCAVLFMLHFSLLANHVNAQGLPLIRNFTTNEYGGHNRCFDIEIGDDGTIYVANFEGLLYYDHVRWRIIHAPDISRVTVVYRDSQNTIWVGGYNLFARLEKKDNGELYMEPFGQKGRFKGEVMEIFEEDGSLQFVASDNNIYSVRDNTISLKMRTNANFLPGIDSDIVSLEALKNGKENAILDDVTQIEQLDGGLQVVVKKNNGLIITDSLGKELYTITEENGLCSNQIAYVAYDGHGMLWGATLHGIFAIELPSVYSYFLAKDGFTGEVHAITAFNDMIFAGGSNGIYFISSRQCKRINEVNNICWMLSSYGQDLLAATSSGIYKIKSLHATKGRVETSRMTSNATTAIFVDGEKVYAGEPDGVWLYESDFKQRIKLNDLQLVTDIRRSTNKNNQSKDPRQNDNQTGLWFQNVHGETIGSNPEAVKEPLADISDNLLMPVSDIEVKAQYLYGNQVWIGGDEVLAIIDTDKKNLLALADSRTVRFRSIIMVNDSVLWGGFGNMPKALPKLSSNERHLHFFYALDYSPLSGKTLYRYKLSNNNWSGWTDKQDIEYLNLPYGSYTLSVQAKLANGELSEVTSIDFTIAYPLFMRWYMLVLYLFLFAYVVYLLFLYRLKKLKKDKIKLEKIVEERTADLRNAQGELIRQEKMASVGKLTEGLIDRILNPMNYIINFSKMSNDLLKDLKENIDKNKESINEDDYDDTLDVLDMLTENLQNVDQYGQNTTRILKAMEEMLKDRNGGYVDTDLLPVLVQNKEMLYNYYSKEIEEYHIQVVFSLPAEQMPLHGNPEMLSKTMMSLLGNSIYAVIKKAQKMNAGSSAQSYVPEIGFTVSIPSKDTYILTIRDNGIGIEDKILDKVFDPFFTTKTTDEAAGVGLYLSREIIQNHGGTITVKSVKDEYTEFTVTLSK